MALNNLKSPKGATRKTKRIGRGQGSGQGTQAGKGHKGQKARAGASIALGFEGGQMPLYRRLPKRGFSNAPFKIKHAVVNLSELESFEGDTVSRETLIKQGQLKGNKKNFPLKVLAKDGEKFSKALTFSGVDKFSAKARELIEKAGGKIQNPPRKDPKPKAKK
ncbi:MAG: 50S ribosomal protein L15 [Bacteriovoracales bacterium]|nr:50S ribosomal protein L15 [Bacteriovoracales bacterium]